MHSSNTLGFALATVPFTDRQENGHGTVMVRSVAKHAPKSGRRCRPQCAGEICSQLHAGNSQFSITLRLVAEKSTRLIISLRGIILRDILLRVAPINVVSRRDEITP